MAGRVKVAATRPGPHREVVKRTLLQRLSVGEELLALGGILALGLAIRLVWVQAMPVPPESDFATYYQMAQTIAHGQWLANDYGWVLGGPVYPLALAPILALGGDLGGIRVANVAFQLGTVLAVWLAGRALFGPGAGLASALLAALAPGLWLWAPLVAAENLSMLLLMAIVATLSALWHRPRCAPAWALLGGLTVALAYARPAYLGLGPLIVVAAVLVGGWTDGQWLAGRRLAPLALGVVLVLAPLVTANYRGDGPLFPIGAASFQLWMQNNERATGAWYAAGAQDDYPFRDLPPDADLRAAQVKLALQFMVANPHAALAGFLTRHDLN